MTAHSAETEISRGRSQKAPTVSQRYYLPRCRSRGPGRARRDGIHAQAVVGIGIDDSLVSNPGAVLVDPAQRLLEQARFGITLRHSAFKNVKPVFVHGHESERARLIGVVGDLYGMPFHHVLPFPGETSYLHVALKKLQRCIHDCAAFILFPICGTNDRTGVRTALRVARWTRLGTFDSLLFESAVIDDCQGVAFAALLRAVHARRKGVVHLRCPGGFGYLRLPRKIQLESVLRVDVFGPFLSNCGARYTKQQNAKECCR